jgi:hypothetical protein
VACKRENISNNKLKEERLELFMSKSNCFPEREREREMKKKNLFELNLKRKSTNHLLESRLPRESERVREES